MVVMRRLVGITLAVLVVAFLLAFMGSMLGVVHFGGGCNHIPLVNGQPAHSCASQP